jgi:hypothetical protein
MKHIPWIKLIANSENGDFAKGNNSVISLCNHVTLSTTQVADTTIGA